MEQNRCQIILKSGRVKGEKCLRPCLEGKNYCFLHRSVGVYSIPTKINYFLYSTKNDGERRPDLFRIPSVFPYRFVESTKVMLLERLIGKDKIIGLEFTVIPTRFPCKGNECIYCILDSHFWNNTNLEKVSDKMEIRILLINKTQTRKKNKGVVGVLDIPRTFECDTMVVPRSFWVIFFEAILTRIAIYKIVRVWRLYLLHTRAKKLKAALTIQRWWDRIYYRYNGPGAWRSFKRAYPDENVPDYALKYIKGL